MQEYPDLVNQMFDLINTKTSMNLKYSDKDFLFREMVQFRLVDANGLPTDFALKRGLISGESGSYLIGDIFSKGAAMFNSGDSDEDEDTDDESEEVDVEVTPDTDMDSLIDTIKQQAGDRYVSSNDWNSYIKFHPEYGKYDRDHFIWDDKAHDWAADPYVVIDMAKRIISGDVSGDRETAGMIIEAAKDSGLYDQFN